MMKKFTIILSHRSACKVRVVGYVNSQVLLGLNFLQIAEGLAFLHFKEHCRQNVRSIEVCESGNTTSQPLAFNGDNVLFGWPSNDNLMHLFLRDFGPRLGTH